jgi:hypothetical protein
MLTNAPYWDTSMNGEVERATANYTLVSFVQFCKQSSGDIITHVVEPV